ncbi:FecR family protein [Sunxiuqinia sp. sy24]|uniref:FecR family protein n=1 Tax=Sunxiuqinia sp. sy24 TaxID=3461495 RepID=UPI0040454E7A
MGDSLNRKLDKLRTGTVSGKDEKELLALFHKEGVEYDLKKELYLQLEGAPAAEDDTRERKSRFERLWKKIETSENRTVVRKLPQMQWYVAAAMLLIGLLIGNLLQPKAPERVGETTYYTAIAPKGSISQAILPDGTIIFLNSGSEIRYATDMSQTKREVYLNGEAWFDVRHSEEIPFLVHTDQYDVKVMGTEFNVKAYRDDQEVVTTLEEGSIQVQSANSLKLERDIELVPGEQLVYNKTEKTVKLKEVRANLFSSWKDNKLIFINMNLGELITLLERKYGVDIIIQDQQLLKHHYDGTIRNETIVEVLDILQKTLPINYVIQDQKVIIKKK